MTKTPVSREERIARMVEQAEAAKAYLQGQCQKSFHDGLVAAFHLWERVNTNNKGLRKGSKDYLSFRQEMKSLIKKSKP